MNEEVKQVLKEQDWVVGEDGKAILEYILSKLDILEELYQSLAKTIELLDERMTLQDEIDELKRKIEELEDEKSAAPVPGRGRGGVPAPGVCTPSRIVYTKPYAGISTTTDVNTLTSSSYYGDDPFEFGYTLNLSYE